MKKETKKLIDSIISYILIILIVIAIPVSVITLISEKGKASAEREQFIYELYEARLEAETYEAVNEMLIDLYEEAKEDLEKLRLKYEKLIDSNEFNVQQIISDFDDAFDYYFNYESYLERNPDVSFEQYLQLRNPELYARLLEYGKL